MSMLEASALGTDLPSRVHLICSLCSTQFDRKKSDVLKAICKGQTERTFCSTACYRETKTSAPVSVNCRWCRVTFTVLKYEWDKKVRQGTKPTYCSKKCMGLDARVRYARPCRGCSTPMVGVTNRWYCTPECRAEGRRRNKKGTQLPPTSTCPQCCRVFHQRSSRTAYCDRACANAAHSKAMTGTGNSRYRDGTSYATWFRKMRPLILERDGHRCVACHQTPPPIEFIRKETLLSFIVGDPSHQREAAGQSIAELGYSLHGLPCAAPSQACDTVSLVREVCGEPVTVYDLQVEGNSNFLQTKYWSTTAA